MRKNIKFFLFHFLCLLWLEGLFEIINFDNYMRTTVFSILFFILPVSIFITILTQIFSKKTNSIIGMIIYGILGFWFSLELIFNQTFQVFFSISLFGLADQAVAFGGETILAILKNLPYVILFFIPLGFFILFKDKLISKRISDKRLLNKQWLVCILVFILSLMPYQIYTRLLDEDSVTYRLLNKINDNMQNIQNLGVLNAAWLDVSRTITGFEEEIVVVVPPQDEGSDEIFEYDPNILDIDFEKGNNSVINKYMTQDTGTKKNRYTGIFKGKNIIYITAESFHMSGVSEELTPTLYKLINSGFVFENFYVPNNLSTIGGEFHSITGLYADHAILSKWRSGTNYFPMGLANMFKAEDYNVFAYHNNSYTFQDRDKYLKSQGFDKFFACYNGLEKKINCKPWPQSDVEMIDKTTSDYMDSSNPFLAYYMTVSGHFGYARNDNSITNKHWDLVKDLPYNEETRGYIATQIELDRALELLINRLEEKGILDDTVIVLQADHYPYGLGDENVETLVGHSLDSVELHHTNLIIWNSKVKTQKIDKVCMNIDVLPTVYNLFGLDYDSRLFMGKDIFSSTEGIAILKDRSWVTSQGTYYASSNKFVPKNGKVDQNYINNINQIVNNRLNISKRIIESDYYKILK